MDELRDEFPIGMSVLAVDDDRICLKILETLLQKCQYHVTTAKNAITALNLLRKNKKKFDLVISDVHMPDMDGFKLLELIGLEMDLPVIMLSANDDPKMVMKGISHGACDYLLKPVRVEELKNIWQHVIRKKKITTKIRNQEETPNSDSCNGLNSAVTANENQNEKASKKRKEQYSDDNDDDDGDIDEHGNDQDNEEDLLAHKKPRVVWSVELHRKFLNAVNQLGVDKAVPKKILDLMNVEHLTRENVASHLQKYRLYLKRNSCGENEVLGNNMVAALGNTNQSYLRMRSVNEIGNLQTLNGSSSRQFQNNGFNVNVHGLPSSGTLQLLQQQNLSNNSTNDQLKFQSTVIRANPNSVQGMPISVSPMQNFTNKVSDYRSKVLMGCSASSPFMDIPNNALMLEPKVVGSYNNLASQSHHSQFSPSLLDNNGMCNDIWSSTMKSPMMNSLTNINSQGWINHNQDVNAGGGELGALNYCFGEPLGMNQLKSQNSGISSSFSSLEDIFISKQKSDNMKFLDGYVFDN